MILQVSCSFVQADLQAAGWGMEPLTAGLGLFSLNLLYFYREFLLCEVGDPGEKNSAFAYWSWGYHLLLPFIWSSRSRMGISCFYPKQFAGMVFHGRDWPVKTIGILEIVNACFFFAVMCIFITR